MDFSIQDGRLYNFKASALQRSNEYSSMLVQALETNDTEMLDWNIENTSPPRDISSPHLAHLLSYLSAKYWVHSNPKALVWIQFLISCNSNKINRNEEFRPVLEDIKSKLRAKTQSIEQVALLKNSLKLITNSDVSDNFTVISQPIVVVNENN